MQKPTYEELERELELRRELDELRAQLAERGQQSEGSLPTVGRYGTNVNIGQARKGKGKIVIAYMMYVSGLLIMFTGHELSPTLGLLVIILGYFVQEFGKLQRWWHWK